MRKATLVTAGGCILAALLSFAAPAFRQAFQVSLAPWHWVFHLRPADGQSGLQTLVRRAEQKHDAEGLAFCAVRIQDDGESARWAEEAVRLDPNLLWVYAVVAVRHPELPEINKWVPKLEQWDPQNALFHMITAESNDILHVLRQDVVSHENAKDPIWQSAMAATFQSSQFDDYTERVEALDRKVASRYGLDDPNQLVAGSECDIPSYTFSDSRNYAQSVLRSGKEMEVKGDKKGAIEKYWAVARYGQVIDSQAHAPDEHWLGTELQSMAYQQLQAVSEKDGNHIEAAHFAYLVTRFNPSPAVQEWLTRDVLGQDVSRWNALEVTASSLMMLFCAAWVALAAVVLILRRKGTGSVDLRAKRIAAKLGLVGAMGWLLSSAMLYLTYHPYAKVFAGILRGDRSRVSDLRSFLTFTHWDPIVFAGVSWHPYGYFEPLTYVVYFWLAVVALGVIGLIFLVVRHFRGHPRASVPA